jgi:hypothetical protein
MLLSVDEECNNEWSTQGECLERIGEGKGGITT